MKHWFVAVFAIFAFISLSGDSFAESTPKKVPVIVKEFPLYDLYLFSVPPHEEKYLNVWVLKDGCEVYVGYVYLKRVSVELRKDGKEFTSIRHVTDPNSLESVFVDVSVPKRSLIILVPVVEDVRVWNEWFAVQRKLAHPVLREPRRVFPKY